MTAWFVPAAIDSKAAATIGGYQAASAERPALFSGTATGATFRVLVAVAAAVLIACSTLSHAQPVAAASQAVRTPQEQAGPPAAGAAPSEGLSALDAMTFSCPKAGLNAAAQEAAKVRSQGTYQFSYFKIINDTHHAAYEVHFKSNYEGEADLKYCVAIYCQQGWDPKKTKAEVTLIGSGPQRIAGAAHGAQCAAPAPVKRPLKR